MKLIKPNIEFVPSYIDFIAEMVAAGEKVWADITLSAKESHTEIVQRLLLAETSPRPGLVPESHYWACQNKMIVGRISLRHTLNENLKKFGGHIGYEVRPSCRRRGFATEMLRLLLRTQKAKQIGHILLTCAPDNVGSNKAILANGGVLKETVYVEAWKRDTNYYWIRTEQNRQLS